MGGYVRTEHCIPIIDIMDLLEDLPPSFVAEVMTLVRDYCRYWDEWETDDGFELPEMSAVARVVWNGVKKKLKASNEKYFYFVECQREKSEKAVAAQKRRQEKRERDRQYYSENKEEINQRRRRKYAAAAVDKFEETAENETDEEQNMSFVSQTTLTDESPLNHTEQGTAENLPAGDRIIDLNNNLVKHSVVIGERGCGVKQVIHRSVVDKFTDYNHPSSGLTGNNPAAVPAEGNNRLSRAGNKPDPRQADPAVESAGKPKPDALAAMCKGQWKTPADGLPAGNREMPETGSKPPDGGNKRPPTRPSPGAGEGESSASVHVRGCGRDKDKPPKRWPAGDEVVIDEDFRLDFLDPKLADLNFLDDFLIRGVEDKLMAWKMGRSVEKRWIRKLIFTFTKKQGRTESLSAELLRRARLKQGGADDGS